MVWRVAAVAVAALACGVAQVRTVSASEGAAANECKFTWTNPDTNQAWQWDFTSLNKDNGYNVIHPVTWNGVTYSNNEFNINICANAGPQCIPSGYTPPASTGAVVQSWGTKPECTYTTSGAPYCEQGGSSSPNCCTKDCSVLTAADTPREVVPYDVSALGHGTTDDGIVMFFPTLLDTNINRSICATDTPTMAAKYVIFCTKDVEFESVATLSSGCEFTFEVQSKYACGTMVSASTSAAPVTTTPSAQPAAHMSGGSVFLLILFILAFLYFGVGTIILRFTTGIFQIPNRLFWVAVGGYIQEGLRFILRGCKRDTSVNTRTAGVYIENDDASSGGDYSADNGEFGNNTTPSHTNDELYDDL